MHKNAIHHKSVECSADSSTMNSIVSRTCSGSMPSSSATTSAELHTTVARTWVEPDDARQAPSACSAKCPVLKLTLVPDPMLTDADRAFPVALLSCLAWQPADPLVKPRRAAHRSDGHEKWELVVGTNARPAFGQWGNDDVHSAEAAAAWI